MKSVEEEKIMASQKLADSDIKMAGLQKVAIVASHLEEASVQ
jgi:hypothetical protein